MKMKNPIIFAVSFFLLFESAAQEPAGIYFTPNRHANKRFVINYNEANIPVYSLPDPLLNDNGKPVTDAKMWWEQRRPELLSLCENEMYGRAPGFAFARPGFLRNPRVELRAEKKEALNGKAIRREVRLHFTSDVGGPFIDVLLYLPAAAKRPVPAVIMLNFSGNHAVTDEPDVFICESWMSPDAGKVENYRATEQMRGSEKSRFAIEMIINRGYALATANYNDIDPDYDDGFQNAFHPYFFKEGQTRPAPNEWGTIAAWAWGCSRILDYLETVPAINPKQVAVGGHSRLGKTALWAGASDQRFAAVIVNNSGCGGSALSKRVYGETIGLLNYVRPHWFCDNFKYYSDTEAASLPFDQHAVVALVAPRPIYIAVAENDRAADPKGEFLCVLNADPVYRLLGVTGIGDIPEKSKATRKGNMIYDAPMPQLNKPIGGTIGFHIRTGGHDVTDYDWEQYLNFMDKFFIK